MYLRKRSSHRSEVSIDEPLNVDWDGNELLLSDVLGSEEDGVGFELEKQEEKRILYVAMTRAKKKLILTATVKDRQSLSRSLLRHPTSSASRLRGAMLKNAASPLDLVLASLSGKGALEEVLSGKESGREGDFIVSFVENLSDGEAVFASAEETGKIEFSPQEVLSSLAFSYSREDAVTLPNKLSVSQLLTRAREEEGGEFYPTRLLDFENGLLVSGAEKIGTATHQVMQFCNFDAMEKNPNGEFERLEKRGFLSREDLALVDRGKLLSFFRSPLYRRMKESSHVLREKRFNVLLSGEEIGVGSGEVLVQGVVDAWFENPDGTLTILDFKTDRVKPENGEEVLCSRHADQLRLYALAVEKMTGKKVSSLAIFSFALEKEVVVTR